MMLTVQVNTNEENMHQNKDFPSVLSEDQNPYRAEKVLKRF